ncbi:hypothetical protein E2562_007618 [Oryza meyeriana var. granulata]|uniref:F-box domain-containing protein n=1 Tax=Oryza meyeriana var. granulata TaxID=110450 RepID=A0A6G1DVW5_9ORYZ|nr:hypothetical protein E2562_007618 [Oryza meyeriana var. granulata]
MKDFVYLLGALFLAAGASSPSAPCAAKPISHRTSSEPLRFRYSKELRDEDPTYGCQTPRESFFDPFAPGPEELACAPKKKVIRATEVPSRRQLSFESDACPDAPLRQSLKVVQLSPSICRKLNFDSVSPRWKNVIKDGEKMPLLA